MKFVLFAVTLLALFAANEAQFFGRRFGLGLGFRGRFGFGGIGGFGGFGGFGFGGFPVPMPVPVPVPVPMPVPPIGIGMGMPFGKRSELLSIEVLNTTESSCTIESFLGNNSTLTCSGHGHTFECELERQFNVTHMVKELEGLRILPFTFDETSKLERTVLLSVEPSTKVFNNFTMEHETETKLFSVFHDETVDTEGFRIVDDSCWTEFEKMIEEDKQTELRMKLDF